MSGKGLIACGDSFCLFVALVLCKDWEDVCMDMVVGESIDDS